MELVQSHVGPDRVSAPFREALKVAQRVLCRLVLGFGVVLHEPVQQEEDNEHEHEQSKKQEARSKAPIYLLMRYASGQSASTMTELNPFSSIKRRVMIDRSR